MGMYTEINVALVLRKDTPHEVITTLQGMLENGVVSPLDHAFFRTERWQYLLRCGSYYFAANEAEARLRWDDIGQDWRFTLRSNIKNYDREIQEFMKWLAPYLDMSDGEFLGYMRYEESPVPTLFFKGCPPKEVDYPVPFIEV